MIERIIKTARQRKTCPYMFPLILLYRFIKKEDITVVVTVRNIDDKYLINCLKSIREQTYDQSLIKISLVDYDSEMKFSSLYKTICEQYYTEYIKADNRPVWCKTNALNLGIRKAKTKYILIADVDIIFEKNYIEEGIKELQKNPFQVIVNAMLDLPDIAICGKSYAELKLLGKPRYNWEYHCSINLTFTCFYHKLRGYDEKYKLWGSEDDDLAKRFKLFGLALKSTKGRTSYLHQYHEKFRGVKNIKGFEKQREANLHYCNNTYSIVRNRIQWGE